MSVRKPYVNALRQMRLQVGSLLGLVIIIGVAVGFYATLKTNAVNFESSTFQYFRDYKLPELIVDGSGFEQQDADQLQRIPGVAAVQVRTSLDARHGENTVRLLSYDVADPRANLPYLYEGKLPSGADECLVAEKYATKNKIRPGDTISFRNRLFDTHCKVSGTATTPEDMYLKQTATGAIANAGDFGVVYVDTELLSRYQVPLNQVALVFTKDADAQRVNKAVERALGSKVSKLTEKKKVGSYDAFIADVGDYDRMAHIFPIVFLVIGAVVVFVGQRRNVLRDRRQIGILKAMGCSSAEVIALYCMVAVVATVLGIAWGAGIARIAGPFLVDTYLALFNAPYFTFEGFGEHLWLPGALSIVVTLSATLIAVYSVVTIPPAEAMRAAPPPTGRDIWLQRTPLWRRLRFHSRYSLKAALRNRGRFAAMIFGVIASVSLMIFSLGLQDSYKFITTDFFKTAVDYDLAVRTPLTPSGEQPGFVQVADFTAVDQALVLAGTFTAGDRVEDLPLVIMDNPDAIYNFQTPTGGPVKYADGIVLPEYYAERLGVSVGDRLKVSTPNDIAVGEVRLAALAKQNVAFVASMDSASAKRDLHLQDVGYNTVFAQTNADILHTKELIEAEDGVLAVSSTIDERESFETFSATLNMYIVLLVGFSIVLGIAALYSVSTITLLARQYEFVLLRVMGYSPWEISLAYLKELALQCVIGLPLGMVTGFYMTSYISRKFTNTQLLFEAHIHWDTYAWSACAAAGVIVFVWLVSIHKVSRLQLVEGLKARDE